jgi:hypothetical protein
MIFCSYCGRQHNTTACPPQELYQPNPIATHLDVESLLSIIRSQAQHIQLLEANIHGEQKNTKIVEVPVEINEEKVIMLKDLLSCIRDKEITCSTDDELKEVFQDAIKIISNQKTTLEFIKSSITKIR